MIIKRTIRSLLFCSSVAAERTCKDGSGAALPRMEALELLSCEGTLPKTEIPLPVGSGLFTLPAPSLIIDVSVAMVLLRYHCQRQLRNVQFKSSSIIDHGIMRRSIAIRRPAANPNCIQTLSRTWVSVLPGACAQATRTSTFVMYTPTTCDPVAIDPF